MLGMAAPNQPEDATEDAQPGSGTASPTASPSARSTLYDADHQPPKVLRLRLVPWDVVCTVLALGALLLAVSMTPWLTRLFAFTDDLCLTEDCPPVPFGVNYYIYPLMWGGIGAAITAAVIGPFVSMLKGWYMSFWPFVSIAVLSLSSVAGRALAGFSGRYWH
jgi:hypothetical protein